MALLKPLFDSALWWRHPVQSVTKATDVCCSDAKQAGWHLLHPTTIPTTLQDMLLAVALTVLNIFMSVKVFHKTTKQYWDRSYPMHLVQCSVTISVVDCKQFGTGIYLFTLGKVSCLLMIHILCLSFSQSVMSPECLRPHERIGVPVSVLQQKPVWAVGHEWSCAINGLWPRCTRNSAWFPLPIYY